MATTFFSSPYELGPYDTTMYQIPQYDPNDPTLLGPHFSNFSQLHCGDPTPDFAYFPIYPLTTCVDATPYPQLEGAPVAINPQVLHTPASQEPHVEDALYDCARSTPELVSTPQPPPQVVIREAYETFNPLTPARAEVYPMKKDRQKGSANLLRSVCPAPLQNPNVPCPPKPITIILTNCANRRKTPIDNTNAPCVFGNSKDALTWLDTSSGIKVFDPTNA
jgi:hypothetical protein